MQQTSITTNASAATTAQISIDEIIGGKDINPIRRETMEIARANGATEAQLIAIRDARRTSRGETIILPTHRFENLSRGRGWCRKGKRDAAEWGEKEDGGYRVGSGRWTVGGNDGFSRKGEDVWDVKNITIGEMTVTTAD